MRLISYRSGVEFLFPLNGNCFCLSSVAVSVLEFFYLNGVYLFDSHQNCVKVSEMGTKISKRGRGVFNAVKSLARGVDSGPR